MNAAQSVVKVALLGAGSVGSQVAKLLLDEREELAGRIGADIELIGIAVRDTAARRDTELPGDLLTTDAESLIKDADIVVELMGGLEPASRYLTLALESGADVVTANKALMAHQGKTLVEHAQRVGAQLYYEAAVAGAIPILRPLRANLAGDRIDRVLGIVNGTTNFILDRMTTRGESLERALEIATELGYAEADPTADIEGYDAQQKAAILATLAFHTHVPIETVHREGITGITQQQITAAEQAGYRVKLLAICERTCDEQGHTTSVAARVHPALVSQKHPLAAVHGGNNAVFISARAAGDLMFYGAGAGGIETASAVLGDVVTAARRHVLGGPGDSDAPHDELPVADFETITTRYQISLEVIDEPGVLRRVSEVFEAENVSVASVEQRPLAVDEGVEAAPELPTATLVVGTHRASEGELRAVAERLRNLEQVQRLRSILRVETDD